MCVSAKRLRDDLVELGFHVLDRLSRSEPSPVTYTEHVGIDGKGFFAERSVENNICSLPSDAGKRLEVVARAGDLAVIILNQRLAERDDILRLGVKQTDRLDRRAQLFLAQCDHLLGRPDVREQRLGRDVDACIGCLRGENNRDEERVGVGVV